MITLAWINQSDGQLQEADCVRIVEALNLQSAHVAAGLGIAVANLVAAPGAAPAGAVKAYFLPNADVAGALGYHDVDPQGDPYIRVFTETVLAAGGTALSGAVSISVCASHEMCEAVYDPSCTGTATDAKGQVWALETADPVESLFYPVTCADGTVVDVSDFVLPAFFDPAGVGPFDHLGHLTEPFTIATGGYAVINNNQVLGDKYEGAWKAEAREFPVSRTFRRLHPAG